MKAKVRLTGQAKEEYQKLEKLVNEEEKKGIESSENQTLFRSIKQKIELLKQDPLCGEVVKKNKIPKNLDVDNLFKLRLANFWRMLYTIRRQEIEIYCFILTINDHDEYDKTFKGKKRA